MQTGAIVDSKYEILECLCEGGMGSIYKARHRESKRFVALKIFRKEYLEDDGARLRFRREATAAAALAHPNIAAIFDCGTLDDGALFLVMEYIEGTPLNVLLKTSGPLVSQRALHLCKQIARALDFAHSQDIVHRDLKPTNILIATRNGEETVKLIGFGPKLNETSDVYSFGCVLYEMLAGHPLVLGNDKIQTGNDSAAELKLLDEHSHGTALQTLLKRCLQKTPEGRYPTMTDLLGDLDRWETELKLSAPRNTQTQKRNTIKSVRYVVPFTGRFTVSGTAIGAKKFKRKALVSASIGLVVLFAAAILAVVSAKQFVRIKDASAAEKAPLQTHRAPAQ